MNLKARPLFITSRALSVSSSAAQSSSDALHGHRERVIGAGAQLLAGRALERHRALVLPQAPAVGIVEVDLVTVELDAHEDRIDFVLEQVVAGDRQPAIWSNSRDKLA